MTAYPTLPETGFLRLPQIIGDRRATPPVPGLIPVCPSTWWAGVADARFPAPIKIGGATVWRVEEIRELIERLSAAPRTVAPAVRRRQNTQSAA